MPESLPGATTALREELGREQEVSADLFAATIRLGEALAAARRECEGLRKALDVAAENLCLEGPEHDAIGSPPCGDPICTGCVARAALAAPGDGEEGKR